MTTRREFFRQSAALAAATAVHSIGAAIPGYSDADYRRAIVIDGLGGIDDPYSSPEVTVMDPRAIADLHASGLTMVHMTVNAVSNGPEVWAKTIARIEKEKMLVDFSHGGQRTIAEGLAVTTRTPVISHTGCLSLFDNPRNDDRAAQGTAAPGEGPDIFNIVAEWDDIMRYRHLADGLSKWGWTTNQIEKALGGNLLRVYGDTFG